MRLRNNEPNDFKESFIRFEMLIIKIALARFDD